MEYYKTFHNFGLAMAFYKRYKCSKIKNIGNNEWIVYTYKD